MSNGSKHQSKPDAESSHRWWALTADEVLQELATNSETGLTVTDAEKRRNEYGKNELTEEPPILVEIMLSLY
jgi:magnesium-transporting ATPase (P-type)